jgi:hypothetical protein
VSSGIVVVAARGVARRRLGLEIVLAEGAEVHRRAARRRVEPGVEVFLGEQHRVRFSCGSPLSLVARWKRESSGWRSQLRVRIEKLSIDSPSSPTQRSHRPAMLSGERSERRMRQRSDFFVSSA